MGSSREPPVLDDLKPNARRDESRGALDCGPKRPARRSLPEF